MKKLLSILGSLTVSVAPTSVTVMNTYNKQVADDYSKYQIDFDKTLFNNYIKQVNDIVTNGVINSTNEDLVLRLGQDMENMLYFCYDRQENSEYSNLIEQFVTLARTNLNGVTLQKFNGYETNWRNAEIDWSYQWDSINNAHRAANLEKQTITWQNILEKLYYANNEDIAKKISDDLATYQPYREDLAKYTQENVNNQRKIADVNEFNKQFGNMQNWSKKIKDVFYRVADQMQIKADEFLTLWKEYFGSPEAFAKKMVDVWKDQAQALFDKYLDKEEDKFIDQFKDQFKEAAKAYGENPTTPQWMQDAYQEKNQNLAQGEKPVDLTPEEIKVAAESEVQKQIDEQNADSSEKKYKIIKDIANTLLNLNQTSFKQLFDAADSVQKYMHTYVPSVLGSIKDAYLAGNIEYTSETELNITTALETFGKEFTDILALIPQTKIAAEIGELAFSGLDAILNWTKTLDAANGFDEEINTVRALGDILSQIDPSIQAKYDEMQQEMADALAYQDVIDTHLADDNAALANSKLDEYKTDLENWQIIFRPYQDIIDIDLPQTTKVVMDIDFDSNLASQLATYKNMVLRSQFTYAIMLNKLIDEGDTSLDVNKLDSYYSYVSRLSDLHQLIFNYFGGEA